MILIWIGHRGTIRCTGADHAGHASSPLGRELSECSTCSLRGPDPAGGLPGSIGCNLLFREVGGRMNIPRFRAFIGAVGLTTALVMLLPAQSALAALNTTTSWSNNDYVGNCAEVNGGYVIAAQSFLWGQGYYNIAVDNWWGSNSDTALRNYQNAHGLSVDGCAGPNTWGNMQGLLLDFGSGTNPRYESTSSSRYSWYNYSHANNDTTTSCRWSSFTETPSNYSVSSPVQKASYDFEFSLVTISPFPNC